MKNLFKIPFLLFLIFFSCESQPEYEKIKARELNSKKINQDLFLDLHLGMKAKDFFIKCWEHNKNGILINGAHELQIQYLPETPSGKEVYMFFYPKFKEDKLFFMPIEFKYINWFPTLPEYSNEYLINDVIGIFEKWYGPGFFKIKREDPKFPSAFIKIDGNRQVMIYKKNLSTVRVEIIDLNVQDLSPL